MYYGTWRASMIHSYIMYISKHENIILYMIILLKKHELIIYILYIIYENMKP